MFVIIDNLKILQISVLKTATIMKYDLTIYRKVDLFLIIGLSIFFYMR